MSAAADLDDRYRVHRAALRRRVCSVCLDAFADGECGLVDPCAMLENLPAVVEAILAVRDRRETAYAAAVEARVCARCRYRDAVGLCRSRETGRCALSVFLPLIVEAVEEVESRPHAGA